MAYYRRRAGAWAVEVRRKGFAPVSRTFGTKAEAERWAADVEGKMLAGRYVDTREAEATPLSEALERYAREVTPGKKGAAREADRIRRWAKDPLAAKPLAAVRGADLAAWRDARLKAGAASGTVRLDLAVISHLYTVAFKEWGLPVANPCAGIRMPPAGRGRDTRATPAQVDAIVAEASKINAELPPWIILAVETGMRRGEIAALRREWVKGRVARLPDTKNGTARNVPLSRLALATLAALPARLDGRALGMDPKRVTAAFAVAAARAGFPDIRFHDLRHEATSRLFERGLNPIEVGAITGHKDLSQLRRYTHLNAEALADRLG